MEKYEELKESLTIELKRAKNKVPASFYESYSAMANTLGGDIYLGIDENNIISPIEGVDNVDNEIRDIFNALPNKTKISVSLITHSDIEIINYKGKNIIKIHVPQAPVHLKPVYINGNPFESFKRTGKDGDVHMERHEILSLLNDASNNRYDMQPNSHGYVISDLCHDTIASFRRRYERLYPGVSSDLPDELFLLRIGATKRDKDNYVVTNAGLAVFGYAAMIRDVFPYYKVDFQDKTDTNSRWASRIEDGDISWSGNLYDFFIKVSTYLSPILPSEHEVHGFENTSGEKERESMREAILNAIFNCDFFRPSGIKITYDSGQMSIENAGRMIVPLKKALIGGDSIPRNEGVMILFRTVKYGERSGQGIPTIYRNFGLCHYVEPEIKEEVDPIEKTIMTLRYKKEEFEKNSVEKKVLAAIKSANDGLSSKEISDSIQMSRSSIIAALGKLLNKGIIESFGGRTNGKKYRMKQINEDDNA